MDRSDTLDTAREALPHMAAALSLTPWSITLTADPEDDPDTLATVSFNHLYQSATINLDPNRHSDPSALLSTLRHELLHLLLSPYDLVEDLYEPATHPHTFPLLEKSSSQACELAVRNLETLLDTLGHTAKSLATPPADPVNRRAKKKTTKRRRKT